MATKTLTLLVPSNSELTDASFQDPYQTQLVLNLALNYMKKLMNLEPIQMKEEEDKNSVLKMMEAYRTCEEQKNQLLIEKIEKLEEDNKELRKRPNEKMLTIQDLGRIAEEEVSNCICEVIPSESLDISNNNQHTATTHGDRHILAARGSIFQGLCMFVEVKRKNCIRAEDITRFHSQISQDINGRVNAALFVSTNCEMIPNSTFPVTIELLSPSHGPQIPIAFVASSSKRVIQTAALALAHLQQKCTNQTSIDTDTFDIWTQTIKHYLPKIILFLEKQEEYSRKKIDSLFAIIHEIQHEREDLNEINQMIHNLFESLPFLKTSIPEETLLLFERVMTRKRYQNSDEVKMADFTSREKTLIEKGGGITNIKKRFKGS